MIFANVVYCDDKASCYHTERSQDCNKASEERNNSTVVAVVVTPRIMASQQFLNAASPLTSHNSTSTEVVGMMDFFVVFC